MFFSIDGGDGAGKSTQIELLAAWLRQQGRQVVVCRDPGTTPLGEAVREILLRRLDMHIARTSEMFLYMAARAQLVEEVIRPALKSGKVVISDRYLLANVVYQGYGGGLDVPTLWEIGQLATGGLMPELTLVLDLPAETAAARIGREPDRMELQGAEFHARVHEGFLEEARRHPGHIVVIDATRPVECVAADVQLAVQRVLQRMAYEDVDEAAEEQNIYGLA